MLGLKPVIEALALLPLLAPTVVVTRFCVKLTSFARSMANPVSLVELSVQERLICPEDTAVAVSAVGAAGGRTTASVVALAVLELVEGPALLVARTRKKYGVLALRPVIEALAVVPLLAPTVVVSRFCVKLTSVA